MRRRIGIPRRDYTEAHVEVAQRTYLKFGKGRHPAALNFGDCMFYATARLSGEPLLAVDDDFTQTDLTFEGLVGYWPTIT
jgi:ribonuclease VapC